MFGLSEKVMSYVGTALGVFLIILLGFIAIKVLMRITKKTLERSTLDESTYTFILNVLKVLLYIILIVVILGYLNVPTAPLVTVLGAGGAAIALALKDSLGNIAGGILILVNQMFKKGDVIEVNGKEGYVDSIDLFVTTLKTYDNKVVTVPNGVITTSVIVNYSKEDMRRVDCVFGISYDSDIEKAKDVLLAVTESCPLILNEPEPIIGVKEHQDSAIAIDLKAWCKTSDYWTVWYFLAEQVKLAFDEANISIPYPHVDVHVTK
ncbi:MAG: mechanosensitive ion channel family protein [Firmicutes bacterium]|nr:mechanosensitive ion channel family protein [Bacillota bacterium]